MTGDLKSTGTGNDPSGAPITVTIDANRDGDYVDAGDTSVSVVAGSQNSNMAPFTAYLQAAVTPGFTYNLQVSSTWKNVDGVRLQRPSS